MWRFGNAWWWLLFLIIFILLRLGYGWGYRGWGLWFRRSLPNAMRPEGQPRQDPDENSEAWGWLAGFLWIMLFSWIILLVAGLGLLVVTALH